MEFDLSSRSEAWRRKLQAFFDKEVLPRHDKNRALFEERRIGVGFVPRRTAMPDSADHGEQGWMRPRLSAIRFP